ncbi:MAG TPA: hypothetical protein VMV46_00240 [Thermoanaerobaculia bacterium]|nr:hypothetical protein [Thermoanaerobaculia bacterium]
MRPHGLLRPLAMAGALLAGAPALLLAQDWAGVAGVGVEVRGGGGPVADARVELAWMGGRQLGGPGAVLTGASGRVEVAALAEGRWLLRIRHPGFMGYDAELELRAGRKPEESRVTVVKTGDSTVGLRVRYHKVEGVARPARTAPPAPEPAVASRPVPADPAQREAPAEPAEPEPRALPEPETARLVVPGDPPAAPAVSRNVRSSRDGGCFDCRPDEWATHADGEGRPPGGAPCPPDLDELARDLVAALSAEAGPELERYAGPLLPLESALPAARRTLSAIAAPFDAGACQLVALKIPAGARLGGLQMELATARQSLPCLPDGECPGRSGRWKIVPRVEHAAFGAVIVAAFEHEGESREVPRITVYFQPAGDWAP